MDRGVAYSWPLHSYLLTSVVDSFFRPHFRRPDNQIYESPRKVALSNIPSSHQSERDTRLPGKLPFSEIRGSPQNARLLGNLSFKAWSLIRSPKPMQKCLGLIQNLGSLQISPVGFLTNLNFEATSDRCGVVGADSITVMAGSVGRRGLSFYNQPEIKLPLQ